MTAATGYYSLIQYCPDPSRLEAANVGVLLFCPERDFLQAKTATDNRRIRQFFGGEGHDWERINSFKKAIGERLEVEGPKIKTLVDLNDFIARRANRLQITPPRSMLVTEPDKDLQELFLELIGGKPQQEPKPSLLRLLDQRFRQPDLQRKIRRDIRVPVPTFNKEVTIPYGYQNGRFNLIKPVRFQSGNLDQTISTACKYAVEGRSFYDHPHDRLGKLQLVVVGAFPKKEQEGRDVVRKMFKEYHVELVTAGNLDKLAAKIRDQGKELTASQPE